MLDPSDPFYKPLWRRVVIVALCAGWGGYEVLTGSPGFALIFWAVAAYAAYRLFLTAPPTPDQED